MDAFAAAFAKKAGWWGNCSLRRILDTEEKKIFRRKARKRLKELDRKEC